MQKRSKIFRTIGIILCISLGVFIYVRFYFVFAEGTKAGSLNTIQKKGYVFKTFEGKLIQSGFKTGTQSNEFEFSVQNNNVANTLLNNSGAEFELHYKRYFGSLPWRGNSVYIVDSIYAMKGGINSETIIKPR
jgi:hypothetical protein